MSTKRKLLSPRPVFSSKKRFRKDKRKEDDSEDDEEEEEKETINLSKLLHGSIHSHSNSSCYTVNNNIYFNDDITMESVTNLNRSIRELQNDLLIMGVKNGIEPPPIKLHITTYGGLIHAAFSAIACIKSSKVPVHTIVDGYAASAGTLISVCGAKRYIHRHSSMMIHELSGGAWGRMSVMEDQMEDMKKMMVKLKEIYTSHTNLTGKQLDKIMKKDSDWYADECLEKGLVDEILD
jgi:ATP-dependent Clp protease protease subunit